MKATRAENAIHLDIDARPLATVLSASTIGTASGSFYARRGKRFLDLMLAIPLGLLVLPVVAVLAVAVVVADGWPPFHVGKRVSKGGREFPILKLRTMVHDADWRLAVMRESDGDFAQEYSRKFKVNDDPRITQLGKFLRRTSLDELPQIWNVICGDMSLVGPRPIVAQELQHYGDRVSELLEARPGITGSWQLTGRNTVAYPERAALELYYCRSLSLAGDLKILVKTLSVPFRFNGC